MTIQTKTLKVTGKQTMPCLGCENTVKFTLTQVSGVHDVEANYKTQLIRLTFDLQSADLERIQQELDWIGYQVTEAETE